MTMTMNEVVGITEANQNFSAVARKVDELGRVVVFKNNQPKYVIYPVEDMPLEMTDDERLDVAEKRIMKRYRKAFEELAK